jgi:hypothetical protein
MIKTQTISCKIEELINDEQLNESEEAFMPTKFDELIANFSDELLENGLMPVALSCHTTTEYIFAVITFVEMNHEQKTAYSKQKAQKKGLIIPDINLQA